MQYARVKDLKLAYVESGEGEPLVLIHGGNSDLRQYDVFRPLLGDGIRAIAYDQRDSPNSPAGTEPYGMDDHADDAAGLIAALGLSRAHIMGVSYGGLIAMRLAVRHPDLVQSLILGSTAASAAGFRAPDLTKLRDEGADVIERYMMGMVLTPEAYDTDPELVADCRAGLVSRDPACFARRMEAARSHDMVGELAAISAPTLVLHGDEDPMVDIAEGQRLAQAIPDARFVSLAGSRHGITLQHRQRTADLVRQFILGEAARASSRPLRGKSLGREGGQ